MKPAASQGTEVLVDLVLLSWNHLEETLPCLETLFAATTVPSRLFIVDNGSEPAVRQALAQVRPQGAVREVILLQNETNEGFPRGMNRGLRETHAPFACILNNDLRFTPGWLEELIFVAESNPAIGLVTPGSSTYGDYPKPGVSIDAHARALLAERHGRYTEVGMCIGFCVLIKRAVIERVGVLTEEVERIFFEDEDYSMRTTEAGFLNVVAEGAYVFHAEHKTVKKMPEREALFQRNRSWLREKWGRRLRVAWPLRRLPPLGSEALRAQLEEWIGWARRRNLISAYVPLPPDATHVSIFGSVGLVPHADVQMHRMPAFPAGLASILRVLSRVKKPFDIIASPDPLWAAGLRTLGFWYRAPIIPQQDKQALESAWQELRSR